MSQITKLISVLIVLFLALAFTSTSSTSAITTDPNCSLSLGAWQAVAPIPNNHIEGATAVVDGRLYVFTGFFQEIAGVLTPTNTVDVYDLATDTWQTRPTPSPFVGSHAQAATSGQYIYVVGGFVGPDPGTATDTVWRYDTITDNWVALPPLPQAQASGGVVIHGHTLHYIGGLDASRVNDQANHWVIDLNNPVGWSPRKDMPSPRNHFQAVQVDQYIYTLGGQFGHDGGVTDVPLVHAYNTETDLWEQRANTPVSARSHAEPGTFVLYDRVIMVGGRDVGAGLDTMDSVVEYNPQTDSWRQISTLPISLIGAVANVIGDYVVVTAGGTAYNVGQQQTWISQITTNCVLVPYAPQGARNDVQLTHTGTLTSGRAGNIGDRITWTITAVNNGNVREYFNIDVRLPDNVAFESITLDGASYTHNGQLVTIYAPPMNPADEFSFSIVTRITGRATDGLITSLAQIATRDNQALAEVRVLPPVSALPQTGETPWERTPLLLGMLLISLCLVGGVVYRLNKV